MSGYCDAIFWYGLMLGSTVAFISLMVSFERACRKIDRTIGRRVDT